MPVGIAGDSPILTLAGDPVSELQLIEERTISQLLFNLLGTNQEMDELRTLRNDAAFELGITPLPPSQ